MRDDLKNDPGATTVANLNDTNGDGTVDSDQNEVSATPKGRDEIDLMKIVLHKPDPDYGGDATLSVRSGGVRLWKFPTKKVLIDEVVIGEKAWSIPTSTLPKTFWVEAISPSDQLRDIEIKLEYQGKSDTVHATAVWVRKSSRSPWRVRESQNGLPNNPVPGPGKDLPDLIDANCAALINITRISADGSRYGQGTHTKPGAADTLYGGRILYEFEVLPPEDATHRSVHDLGVRFDCTRQVQYRDWAIYIGSGQVNSTGSADFPDEAGQDNEVANDDDGTQGESNRPSHDRIYQFDSPSEPIETPMDVTAFAVSRNTFREWVRVKLKDMASAVEPIFEAPSNVPQGSRASDKYEWHHVRYLKRDGQGVLVEDNSAVSSCAPKLEGTGNGQIDVALLAGADTEGFTATYSISGNSKKWTLTGTSGGSVVDEKTGDVPQGTVWILTLGTKVRVTITQGSTAYATGAEYKFSVFKTTASGGKKNETAEGSLGVTDGP